MSQQQIDTWQFEIVMPADSKWRPVGWLTTNNTRTMHWSKHARIAAQWRRAAYNAYLGRIPAGIGRIRFACQFVFADRTDRDLPNFEPTIKPIVDALQPLRSYLRKGKLVVEPGVGAIPDDTAAFLERAPEMPPGEPLGRTNHIRGKVIVFICRAPAEAGHAR